jgi:hypothetical protein
MALTCKISSRHFAWPEVVNALQHSRILKHETTLIRATNRKRATIHVTLQWMLWIVSKTWSSIVWDTFVLYFPASTTAGCTRVCSYRAASVSWTVSVWSRQDPKYPCRTIVPASLTNQPYSDVLVSFRFSCSLSGVQANRSLSVSSTSDEVDIARPSGPRPCDFMLKLAPLKHVLYRYYQFHPSHRGFIDSNS